MLHERALELRTHLFGPKSHVTAENLRLLAYLEAKQGNHERAAGLAEQACELTRQFLGEQHSETLLCMEVLGMVNWLGGQDRLARQRLTALYDALKQRWGEGHRLHCRLPAHTRAGGVATGGRSGGQGGARAGVAGRYGVSRASGGSVHDARLGADGVGIASHQG